MIYPFNAAEVFKIALEIEENGRRFYEDAQKRVDDPEVKKLFQWLTQAEVNHKNYFGELLAALPKEAAAPTVWDPDNELDQYLKHMADQHVFRAGDQVDELLKKVVGPAGPKEALRLAAQFEKDSIVLFAELKELTDNHESHYQVAKIMKEEQAHLRTIANMMMKLNLVGR